MSTSRSVGTNDQGNSLKPIVEWMLRVMVTSLTPLTPLHLKKVQKFMWLKRPNQMYGNVLNKKKYNKNKKMGQPLNLVLFCASIAMYN